MKKFTALAQTRIGKNVAPQKLYTEGSAIQIEEILEETEEQILCKLAYGQGDWWLFKENWGFPKNSSMPTPTNTVKPFNKEKTLAQKIVDCCKSRNYPLRTGNGEINIVAVEGMNVDGSFNVCWQ